MRATHMSHTPNSISWLHRFAAALTVVAFAEVVVGTFAISSVAAPGVARGSAESPYQAGYRVLVLAVMAGAILLALWLWRSEARRHVKILGAMTAGAALLHLAAPGGRYLLDESSGARAAHAFLAYPIFGLLLCLALFTRTDWRWGQARAADVSTPSLRSLLAAATAILLVESILGAGLSTGAIRTPLHVWTGLVATALALWALEVAWNKFDKVAAVKVPGILLGEAVVLQLFLGLVAHSMELNARASSLPQPGLPVIIATHAAAGALALAAGLFATLQAFRYLAPAASVPASISTAAQQPDSPSSAAAGEIFSIESKPLVTPDRSE